uniref:Chromosome 10 open reading frame 105 n=1 Tax=Sciurus vulgaris TaxID=55149 RepID=A0A8D2DIG9_SCIVU
MSAEGSSLSSPGAAGLQDSSTAPVTPGTLTGTADPLPVLIALACIFLLLASCLLFLTLCKPAALDPRHRRARECMPHHPESPSEPRLQLWKRLGSLRRSLHSFRRARAAAPPRPLSGHDNNLGNCDCTESTKM